MVDRPPIPPPTTRRCAHAAHCSSNSSVEWKPAVAASATAASTGGHDSIIDSGICRFFQSVVPPCVRRPPRCLPVRLVVLPPAGVDLDPEAARLANVQVRDLVDAVDAGAELDRRAGGHEHLGRALDVEPLVDTVGDVVGAAGRAEVGHEPEVVRRAGSRCRSSCEKTVNPGYTSICAVWRCPSVL